MSVSDSGAWKLIIYPLAFLLLIGVIINFTIVPFTDSGIVPEVMNNSNVTIVQSVILNLINSGNVFNVTEIDLWLITIPIPNIFEIVGMDNFIDNQLMGFLFIPDTFQTILTAIFIISTIMIIMGIWAYLAMLIP